MDLVRADEPNVELRGISRAIDDKGVAHWDWSNVGAKNPYRVSRYDAAEEAKCAINRLVSDTARGIREAKIHAAKLRGSGATKFAVAVRDMDATDATYLARRRTMYTLGS